MSNDVETASVKEFAEAQQVSETTVRRRWLPAGLPAGHDERGRIVIPIAAAEVWLEGFDAAAAELEEDPRAGDEADDEDQLDDDGEDDDESEEPGEDDDSEE